MDIDRLEDMQYALENLISAMEAANVYPELEDIGLMDARTKLAEIEREIGRHYEADMGHLCREYERSVI